MEFCMKRAVPCFTLGFALGLALVSALATPCLYAQASDIPSAAPTGRAGMTQEQLGRKLLEEMGKALGGQAWRDRKDMPVGGRTASFFPGDPNLTPIKYTGRPTIPDRTHPE